MRRTATSQAGIRGRVADAIDLVTVDGDRISRGEIYDESDLDAALARFDELQPPAHSTGERGNACIRVATMLISLPAIGTH